MATPRRREMRQDIVDKNIDNSENGDFKTYIVNNDLPMYKPKKLKIVDIIPYTVTSEDHIEGANPGDLLASRSFFIHQNIGEDEDTIVCPKTVKKPCPICKDLQALWKEEDRDEDWLKARKKKKRDLINVADHGDDKMHLWNVSEHLFGKLLAKEIKSSDFKNARMYAHPDKGCKLKIRFEEKLIGDGGKFYAVDRIDFIKRDDVISDDQLDEATELDEALDIMSYSDIHLLHFGYLPESAEPAKKPVKENKSEDDSVNEELGDVTPERAPRKSKAEKLKEKEEAAAAKQADIEKKEAAIEKTRIAAEKKATLDKSEESEDASAAGTGACPHGGKYATDWDELKECTKCVKWDECSVAFDKLDDE